MTENTIIDILGTILVFTGILDALKYTWNAAAIRKAKTSKTHSRKFINAAILNDIIRLLYVTIKFDWFLFISSILAIVCMVDLWITIYLFYPYKYRNLINFKRPNVFIYFINSIMPNNLRRKL